MIQVAGDVIRGSRNQDYNLYVLKCEWDSSSGMNGNEQPFLSMFSIGSPPL